MLVEEPVSIPPQEVSISKSSSAGASQGWVPNSFSGQMWGESWGWLHRDSRKRLGRGPDQNWEKSAKWSPGPPQKPHCYYTHVKRGPGPHHSRLLMLVDLCCWCLCKFSGCGTSKKMNVPVGEVALELAAVDTGAMCPGRPGWGLW